MRRDSLGGTDKRRRSPRLLHVNHPNLERSGMRPNAGDWAKTCAKNKKCTRVHFVISLLWSAPKVRLVQDQLLAFPPG